MEDAGTLRGMQEAGGRGGSLPDDCVERIYAGLLGKAIGVRHGSNVEGWSHEQIESAYGEVRGYLFTFRNFAADDDTNGPLFFLRALEEEAPDGALMPQHVARTLLNYVPYEHGFFWWGGYGTSTESTAYHNLRAGILPPRSGSVQQNGAVIAEQIGGQIFSDCWGLVAPGNPRRAAALAQAASSVMHGGNGVCGGMFIAACISAAFVERDVGAIVRVGLSVISEDSTYTQMVRSIVAFHETHPSDWRACLDFVRRDYWTDRYPGGCHIIPNAAIVVLSLLYGAGDFTDTVNICLRCGFDTDCNCGNVGTIAGVRAGLEGIDADRWRKPINDLMICSSLIGDLNATDLPRTAVYVAAQAYRIAGSDPPLRWQPTIAARETTYDFELPGSTHAFRATADAAEHIEVTIASSRDVAHGGERSLKAVAPNVRGGTALRVYLQTYYRPEDFEDSRYDPSFSPLLYPGQTLRSSVLVPRDAASEVVACLYVKDRTTAARFTSPGVRLAPGAWHELEYRIPALEGVCIEEAGVSLVPLSGYARTTVIAYIDDVSFSGEPEYTIDFSKERIETWNPLHREVSQFTYLKGIWTIENGALSGSSCDFGEAYTGGHAWTDYRLETVFAPQLGERHNINVRVQGAMRSYAVGLAPEGTLALYKNEHGYRQLRSIAYPWRCGERYPLAVDVRGPSIRVSDGRGVILEHTDVDRPHLHGQIGASVMAGSHCHYAMMRISRPA